MFKFIIARIRASTERKKLQARLTAILGIKKTTDCVKVNVPKKYIELIEIIAIYGIDDTDNLRKTLQENASQQNRKVHLN